MSARDQVTGATCPVVTRSAVFAKFVHTPVFLYVLLIYRISSPTTLLALPHDLLEQTFLYLDAEDVRKCTLVSRRINDFILSSVILRYRLACHAAGVVDNPYCTLSFAKRYEALMKREKAWCRFQPAFIKTFNDVYKPISICDLTSGVYLYGDREGHNVHYCFLPSTPDDVLRWTTVPGHAPIKNWNHSRVNILEVGMAVEEHDLMVIVNSWSDDDQGGYSIYMTLLQFSTGEYHPLAHRPRIDVRLEDYEIDQYVWMLEIAGDNLALLIDALGGGQLFIFDWKTGHKRLQHETSEGAYSSLTFVSPQILLVPNVIESQYEVWKIPKEADSVPYQALVLRFPTLSKGHSIVGLHDCRGRPNPHNTLRTSPKPFHTSADETMIMTIVSIDISPNQFGPKFALFMRRRSLLETIANLTRTGVPPPFDVRHHFNKAMNYNDSGMPYSLSFAMDVEEASGEAYSVNSIPWSEWGPPISRWLDAGNRARTTVMTSAGQRWTRLAPVDDDDERYRVSIINFNPYNVYNAQDNLPGWLVVGRKGDYFDHGNLFAEEIEMGLGCTIYTAPEVYDWHHLWLMDDESVFGLKIVEGLDVEKMTVFHFG
ncbi:hypothetical protein F5887DRAFT_1079286 [Amanita rubescens]|nr:hypothetical protein F5887DRAFT_1079286 [Amanita rubescens]